jgi:hypothetical protein
MTASSQGENLRNMESRTAKTTIEHAADALIVVPAAIPGLMLDVGGRQNDPMMLRMTSKIVKAMVDLRPSSFSFSTHEQG